MLDSASESRENKKVMPYVAAIGMIVFAIAVTAWTSWPQSKPQEDRAYFSTDDGKTWFEDSVDLIPPYSREGKTAVRAIIFTTEKGAKPFCGYLQRFGRTVKTSIDAAVAAGAKRTPPEKAHQIAYGMAFAGTAEVKAPGGAEWVSISSPNSAPVLQVKSPDGSELDQVMP